MAFGLAQVLVFDKARKINWAAIKPVSVQPSVKAFDTAKLQSVSYDTSGLRPFSRAVEKSKIDFTALPGKDMDLAKLPSRPLKFKTVFLPAPRPISTGVPRLKDGGQSVYEIEAFKGKACTGF